jgi:hypothetical protein
MKKVQPDNAGLISVKAFNSAGETTASANLIVTGKRLFVPACKDNKKFTTTDF